VTGAGPIGLLAALATTKYGLTTHVVDIVEDGPKPDLVRDLGAKYHAGSAADLDISADLVIDCTGLGSVVREAANVAAPGGVIALTGLSAAPAATEVDLNVVNKRLVLSNMVMFGSVNASRSHYITAAKVLGATDPRWLRRLITRRVPAGQWQEAVERRPDDVKVVLDIGGGEGSW
jgi:threonine dehydrogenase-like Zn-dependent dehydrogenase